MNGRGLELGRELKHKDGGEKEIITVIFSPRQFNLMGLTSGTLDPTLIRLACSYLSPGLGARKGQGCLSTDLTHKKPDSSRVCTARAVGGLVRSWLKENRPFSALRIAAMPWQCQGCSTGVSGHHVPHLSNGGGVRLVGDLSSLLRL